MVSWQRVLLLSTTFHQAR